MRAEHHRFSQGASMTRTITISLPVADLEASKAFYAAIGFTNNPQFTSDSSSMMAWSESINVMLLTHARWRTFTDRPIAPKGTSEVGLNLSCDSRAQVDAMNDAAAANGGTGDVNPVEEHGYM